MTVYHVTCPDCAAARSGQWHGFRAGCRGCEARSVRRSPHFIESQQAGKQTPAYREVLARTGVGHNEALEWL